MSGPGRLYLDMTDEELAEYEALPVEPIRSQTWEWLDASSGQDYIPLSNLEHHLRSCLADADKNADSFDSLRHVNGFERLKAPS